MVDLIGRLFGSLGEVREVHTLVDFYQYIKGVEYLICIAFFAGFPVFYRKINGGDREERR